MCGVNHHFQNTDHLVIVPFQTFGMNRVHAQIVYFRNKVSVLGVVREVTENWAASAAEL